MRKYQIRNDDKSNNNYETVNIVSTKKYQIHPHVFIL